jgi:hypothetical protein
LPRNTERLGHLCDRDVNGTSSVDQFADEAPPLLRLLASSLLIASGLAKLAKNVSSFFLKPAFRVLDQATISVVIVTNQVYTRDRTSELGY